MAWKLSRKRCFRPGSHFCRRRSLKHTEYESHRITERPCESSSHYPEGTPCVQGIFIGCAGGVGGVAHGPVFVEKSKNSVMSGIAASRFVRLGSLKRVSISLSAAV